MRRAPGCCKIRKGSSNPRTRPVEEYVRYAQARYAANMVASLLAVTSLVAAAIGGELQEAPARAALEAAHSEVLERREFRGFHPAEGFGW